ncbi:MAG TPA: phosphodiester glycosidase family protein [Longimicrobiales bacterium]|nr:phosphodiester glycosidase family protein [Longimicrobiales bacterium]
MTFPARVAGLIAVLSITACATSARQAAIAPVAFADADSVATMTLAPGVTHTFVRDARGPWAIHVIEVDARRCEPLLEARKPGTALSERATTSALTGDALAGVNADFFMLPGGTPVGAHVAAGVPLIGPGDRPVFAITGPAPAGWRIGTAQISGHARVRADTAEVAQVNRSPRATSAYRVPTDGLTLFTSWIGDSVPADSAARSVLLRVITGGASGGQGVVVAADSAAAASVIGTGAAVLLARGGTREWARRRTAGDTVHWTIQVTVGPPDARAPVREAVGGFPVLLRDGAAVLAEQTVGASFSTERHPRTAIGWTPDGRLLLVVVDGRQPEWSAGMSLDEMTWLFRSLGASDALNLDGGGSTAMVVGGTVVNRPSDREGERAVGNALALTGCR